MILRLQKKVGFIHLLAFLFLLPSPSQGEEYSPEYVKALYIINSLSFVEIGNPPHKPKSICYFERDGISLEESVGQQIEKYLSTHKDKALAVRKYKAVGDFSGCDVLYIPAKEENNIENILSAASNLGILTISGSPHFIVRGGMIGFITDENDHIKMELNMQNAKKRSIKFTPELLELMAQVIN